jgi:hypothetical protein
MSWNDTGERTLKMNTTILSYIYMLDFPQLLYIIVSPNCYISAQLHIMKWNPDIINYSIFISIIFYYFQSVFHIFPWKSPHFSACAQDLGLSKGVRGRSHRTHRRVGQHRFWAMPWPLRERMGKRWFLEKWHLGPQSWTIKEDEQFFFWKNGQNGVWEEYIPCGNCHEMQRSI